MMIVLQILAGVAVVVALNVGDFYPRWRLY